jgi:16S rRNA (cytosine967-C5)-methyltransferase
LKHFHLSLAAELIGKTLSGGGPADRNLESAFRARRQMGAQDRRVVAETVYAFLRRRRTVERALGSEGSDLDRAAAAAVLDLGIGARALANAGYPGDAAALVARLRSPEPADLSFGERMDLPDWLAERLQELLGGPEAALLARALNQPAPVDLRVNTLRATRAQLAERLAEDGFDAGPTPYSPTGLRRSARAPLNATRAFRDGWFEVQDEGSQLVSLLLEAGPGERICDFCAGAGGKTLQLAALMGNRGTVYAFDTSARRLANLTPRARRAGLSNIRAGVIRDENDARIKRLRGTIDRVLVDAPCSGTGTLRRNPEIKWRALDLPRLTARQNAILDAAARLVRPAGRLLYATCSLLREENEDIVSGFAARHPDYRVVGVNEVLMRLELPLRMEGEFLRMYPHRHNTDAFFAAVLQRKP